MEIYLLKSATCLALLFAFYKLVLERTSIHNFKRFYLLGSLLASFLIPLITFTTYIEVSRIIPVSSEGAPQIIITQTEQFINYWPIVLWTIYGIGVLFFGVKFFRNIHLLTQKIRQNTKYKKGGFIHVLLNETTIPHTFFSYIFSNKTQFESGEIPTEVILHEEAHASQKHSLDIILVEILKIIFWFNPLLYFVKRSIKLNHEFLADQAVLNHGFEMAAYQKLLLTFLSPESYQDPVTPSLAHSINYSSMKKRFSIMKTNTSRRAILFRSIFILPLLSFLIYGFSTTKVVEKTENSYQLSDKEPILKVHVIGKTISVNDKETTIHNFKTAVNAVTKDWDKKDFEKYRLDILEKEISDTYRDLINAEYKKTNLAKQSGLHNVFILGSINGLSQPPIPSSIYTNVPSPSQPVKHVLAMTKLKAKFLYNDKFISAHEAAALLKNNEELGVKTILQDPAPPIVLIFLKSENNSIQQKATKAEVKVYNKLAKKYNAIDPEKRVIKKEDLEHLKSIYKKMSDEQKTKAEPFPQSSQSRSEDKALKKTGFHFNTAERATPLGTTHKLPSEAPALKMYIMKTGDGQDTLVLSEKPVLGQNRLITIKTVSKAPKVPSMENANLKTSQASPSLYNSDKNVKFAGSTVYMYEDKVINTERANELLLNNQNKIFTFISKENGQDVVRLSKSAMNNGKKYDPFSPSPLSLTLPNKGLDPKSGISGATYYYNDMVITPEKANELLENNRKLRVYINKTEDGKGTITLSETQNFNNNKIVTPPSPPVPPKPNSSDKKD